MHYCADVRIHRHPGEIEPRSERVVAYGSFDGLHLGHRRLLDELARVPAPQRAAVLDESAIRGPRLASRRRCCEELVGRQVAQVVVLSAHRGDVLGALRALAPVVVLVAAGESRPDALAAGEVPVREVDAVEVAGAPVTAARLRAAVVAGDLEAAAAMMGRPYAVDGRVVHGYHRGAGIGVPTANLRIGRLQLPPDGVYAVTVRSAGHAGVGVANLGTNPTFENQERSLETHIFDFDGDLYGARLEVGFVAFLRGERKFDGIDALVGQIRRDIDAARAVHQRR
jgi:FAD synthase